MAKIFGRENDEKRQKQVISLYFIPKISGMSEKNNTFAYDL